MYSKETTLYRAIIIATIVIGCIIIIFVASVIKAQRRYRALNSKKLEAIVSAIEKERERIASDMHDELGLVLSSIKLRLSGIDTVSEIDKNSLSQCLVHMDAIINKVRAIAYNFTPSVLNHKGLIFAVQHYIDNYICNTGLKVLLVSPDVIQLPKEAEIHAYRILQEIIYNTVKHAKATDLKIELYSTKNNFFILSSDNGIGFDYNQARRLPSGHGLQSLQTRTEILRGEMNIKSKQGKGTRFHIKLPLINLNQK
jgi:two-component system, NarL family, sensor kinase